MCGYLSLFGAFAHFGDEVAIRESLVQVYFVADKVRLVDCESEYVWNSRRARRALHGLRLT
jgi:hypothetical protein